MPSFDNEFINAKGNPVKYQNFELIRLDRIPVKKVFSASLQVISTNSEWKQGIRLRINGTITFGSCKGKDFILWANDMKDDAVHFEGVSKDNQLIVYNAWERPMWDGNMVTESWLNGAAMVVEIDGNTRIYRCNDGHPDDNFNDIIFKVSINE